MLQTYSEQLLKLAATRNVLLKEAVLRSGVSDSTFYRSIIGHRSLRLEQAKRIERAINEIADCRSGGRQSA